MSGLFLSCDGGQTLCLSETQYPLVLAIETVSYMLWLVGLLEKAWFTRCVRQTQEFLLSLLGYDVLKL